MIKIKDILNELKREVVRPLYYMKGPDYFLQNFFINYLSNTIFKDIKVDKIILLPDEMSGSEIINRLTSQDLFSSKKLFILRSPQQIKGKANSELVNFCKNPVPNHILVLVSDDWSSSATLKKIEKVLDPIDTQTPFENEIKKWARYLFKKYGKTLDPQGIDVLVKNSGDNLSHLNNEIEKICISSGDRDIIDVEDIKKFSGWKREHKRWEFLNSLGRRNYKESIIIGKALIANQESMISLLYPLTYMFQEILFEKINNGTFSNYRSYIPIPQSIKKNISHYAKYFSYEEIESIMIQLGYIDKKQKTVLSIDETDLIQLISNVTR
jgi:DNA polymerase III delta subunit